MGYMKDYTTAQILQIMENQMEHEVETALNYSMIETMDGREAEIKKYQCKLMAA